MSTTTLTLNEKTMNTQPTLQFDGVPSPALLEQYKEIDPALPDQIMQQYVINRETAIDAENSRIRSQKTVNLLAVIFTAVIAVAGITLTGLMFIFAGRFFSPFVAILFALISVLPMIFYFMFHRSEK